jgi:flagellar capping protein FliD
VTGIAYVKPNPAATFQITVGATVVDVTIPKNALIAEAITSINGALTTAGVTTLLASQGSVGGNNVIVLTGSESGSGSSFTVSANSFGLTGTFTGLDVTGTVNGVAGIGGETTLTGSGTLAGLRLAISATQAEIDAAGGTLDLGTVTVSTGLGASFLSFLDSVTETGGLIDRATDRWDAQVRVADDRIEQLESRLDMREAALRRQFAALESTMAQLQGLSNQLFAGLSSLGGLQQ